LKTKQDGGKVCLMHRLHLLPGNTPGTHFCWRLRRLQGHSAIRRMKNFNDTIWDRTSNLLICSTVP
jgi:hypothetical protein